MIWCYILGVPSDDGGHNEVMLKACPPVKFYKGGATMNKSFEIFMSLPIEKQDQIIAFLTRLLTYYPQEFFSHPKVEHKD